MKDLDDWQLFYVTPDRLLEGLRAASIGQELGAPEQYLLSRAGLIQDGSLSAPGQALFKLMWVLRRKQEAEQALGQALRQLTPVQVIEQELRGLGPVPEEGVMDLLLQHRAIPVELTAAVARPTLRWLNSVGVLVFSNKTKTIRSLAPAADAALAGEVQAIAAMISPKTPYRNVVKLRRVIRPMRGIVWWADPHFGARALEELAEELDASEVSEIRILSGDGAGVVSDRSAKDFRRFVDEMAAKGVIATWRVDAQRDWHDRWLADDKAAWNVPPVNTLFKNDYSEISPAAERPPVQEWWDRSTDRPL